MLCVNQGDEVTINLVNTLPETVSIVFPGQEDVLANGVPSQPQFSGSPKLDQGDPEKKRLKPKALAVFADLADQGRCSWKVVCATPHDVHVAADLFRQYEVPPAARWVMPEGTTPQAVMDGARAIADAATHHRLNLTLRSHTLMYGQERAR